MAAALGSLFAKAWWDVPADPVSSFGGMTIIVTGGNTGLGLEAAAKFVKLGAYKVILGVRNLEKGVVAKAAIEARAQRPNVVEVWPLDMQSYSSIRSFVKRAIVLPRLDVVILNAGVHPFSYSQSSYEWQTAIQVNTLSTVLLALLLVPKLRESGTPEEPSHLEIVGSSSQKFVRIGADRSDRDIIQSYNDIVEFEPRKQYQRSKFFLLCCTKELARLEGENPSVVISTVCPGLVRTGLARDMPSTLVYTVLARIFQLLFQRTAEVGSRSIVSGVCLDQRVHGRVWQHDRIQPDEGLLATLEGPRMQQQIWHEVVTALHKDNKTVKSLTELLEDE